MIWITAHIEIALVMLVTLLAAVIILQQRRTPQSTAAWLLSIVLLPYVALPLFLALGFRKRGSRFKPIAYTKSRPDSPIAHPATLDAVFRKFGLPAATAGNSFTLLAQPDEAYRSLLELIDSAQHSVDGIFYIVANDPVGETFVNALEKKARDGVSVRLIMDRLGSLWPPRNALARLEAAGGQIRYFSPLLQRPDSGHLNLRNHRKMVIADRSRVLAGGMNVGDRYMGKQKCADQWTDLSYLLEGPAVQTFLDVYHSDWRVTGALEEDAPILRHAAPVGSGIAQLVPSGPDTKIDSLHHAIVNAIHVATVRVWIVTPYFLPTEHLSNALVTAAHRGVDVRILLPARSNKRLADFARGPYLREMHEAGCKILFFQNGMIHAKASVIDAAAYVGSANFDVRSMLLNFETALFVYDTDSVGAVANWFAAQEPRCTYELRPAGLLRRVAEGAFRLGAPVL